MPVRIERNKISTQAYGIVRDMIMTEGRLQPSNLATTGRKAKVQSACSPNNTVTEYLHIPYLAILV